jgi:hypothetical protein
VRAYGSNSLPLAVLAVLVLLMACLSAVLPSIHGPLEWARVFILAHMPPPGS